MPVAAEIVAASTLRAMNVAGDKLRREAERSQRLHHQHSEVVAGPAPALQGLNRGLQAAVQPVTVGEFGMDGVGHVRQQVLPAGFPDGSHKPPRPFGNLTVGIRVK